jgi:CubicO group peptidase (beta-lactamase class C family)/D-alanyl-D-alanine dipeptidase
MKRLSLVFILSFSLFFQTPTSFPYTPSFLNQPGEARQAIAKTDYSAVIQMLSQFINEQLSEKDLPAISIALVDNQEIVWQKGFGFADPKAKTPPTEKTIYRVGSVSKLFTDIAVMQLVEQGKLDLDAPVTSYIPEFRPRNPFGKAITLRQLMSHRSGLVRETPVGSYFDPKPPTLAQTIASLNKTSLVYAPETRTKYSNAAIATVGYVLERTQKRPFAKYLKNSVLDVLGMNDSNFEPTPEIKKNLAKAQMWTLDGRVFDAPTFELGIAPAGCMYTTLGDLSRFMSALFAGGEGKNGRLLKRETLEQMWTPQTDAQGNKTPYGIGFGLGTLDGHRRIGHGGAIYGFATTLSALPDARLGVVVVATKDSVNAVTNRIANTALKAMLTAREGKLIPQPDKTSPLSSGTAKELAGQYASGNKRFELIESAGKLSLLSNQGGEPSQLRVAGLSLKGSETTQSQVVGSELIVDDRLGFGQKVNIHNNQLIINNETYTRVTGEKPVPAPERFKGLIGEYGWDHDILYIFEKGGKLWCLIEWYEFDPLEEEASPNVFKFPNHGLYDGEKLIFKRDAKGRATQVEAAGIIFKRRNIEPEAGASQLKIKPVRPVAELLKEALNAQPPKETGNFRESELVELTKLDPTIKLEVRYATTNNFLSSVFYKQARAFLQRPAAEALVRAHQKLKEKGYGLLIHDGYRPWYVTKVFWDATPEAQHIFVANPANGSRHNRGCAVDLTLYDLQTGKPVEMVSTYDETTDRAYPDYPGGSTLQRWHRQLLRDAMEAEGFTVFEAEWWHFDYQDWRLYRIGNTAFDKIN